MLRDTKIYLNFPAGESSNNVKGVFMNDWPFKRLPPGIGESVPSLEIFMYINGNIEFVARNTFLKMNNIQSLALVNQKLKFLPEDAFFDLKNLARLNLSGNRIEKLPTNIFSKSLNLKATFFDNNKIKFLDRSLFAHNLKLEEISFKNNQLETIEIDFAQFPNVYVIDLIGNICINQLVSHYSGPNRRLIQEFQTVVNRNCRPKV